MTDVLRAAAEHEGSAFVEIYQNCPVFNDGAFAALTDKDRAVFNRIPLEHGEPIRFGPDGEHGVARAADGALQVVVGDAARTSVVHDAHRDDPTLAFALARLADAPERPDADRRLPRRRPPGRHRRGRRKARRRAAQLAPGALGELLQRRDTWTVA